ncbi:DUF5931 domain-containing protein [Solwaraspora sp. WMMD406]|uniref:MacS family sensor histidine kinase n=1 Tax=Solwaraspora sp. WMMD406 TaxID=3016095 RepID=UPI002417D065|nr:DUF5931 domain-containing protein [Solwaraspora sp. WMMD406]MDG4767651.1 DUF5931 domain-containing protein [Solwaraspora sp. WMMD406]
MHQSPSPPGTLLVPLWRAIAVFRFTALGYVLVLYVRNLGDYAHPLIAIPVLLGMIAWTVVAAYAYARPASRRWPLLAADLAVALTTLLISPWVIGRPALADGVPTLAVAWLAAPVLAWAVAGGRRLGVVAALILTAADLAVRERLNESSVTPGVLMLLAGIAVGHVARLIEQAEQRLQRAVELEAATRELAAATRERERLARDIHDSVLQVLAMVARRGAHLDGEAGELARLAGEQESALRALVASRGAAGGESATTAPSAPRPTDLRTVIASYESPTVTVATPADPVRLRANAVDQIGAAVAAAIDNASRHGGPGTRCWVLVEEEEGVVTVSIRDDGCGIPPGRLDEAAAAGRLGVSQSIKGRIVELGGTVRILTTVGEGTEIELRVPTTATRPGTEER